MVSPFETRLKSADLIFRAHLFSYEKTKASYGFGLIKNYIVDESWKGASEGQIIKIYNHFGVKSVADIPKIPEEPVAELFALRLDPDNKDEVFHSCSLSYGLTPENIKLLSQKFPEAANP